MTESSILFYTTPNRQVSVQVQYAHSEYNEEENAIPVSASCAYSGYVWFHDYKIIASDCSVVRSKFFLLRKTIGNE